jgi:hypothetical protein
VYASPREQASDWDVQQYANWLRASAWRYVFNADLAAAFFAVPIGASFLLPDDPRLVLTELNRPLAALTGLACGIAAWFIARRFTPRSLEISRAYIFNNLVHCGIFDSLCAYDTYSRLPALGASRGRYRTHYLPVSAYATNLRDKLRQLLRSYDLCVQELHLPARPGYDRIIGGVMLGLLIPVYLWARFTDLDDGYQLEWMAAHPLVWQTLLWGLLVALPVIAWDYCMDAAGLRLAIADAVDHFANAAEDTSEAEPVSEVDEWPEVVEADWS